MGALGVAALVAPAGAAATTTTYTDPVDSGSPVDTVEWNVMRRGADVTVTVKDRNSVDLTSQSQYEGTSLIISPQ